MKSESDLKFIYKKNIFISYQLTNKTVVTFSVSFVHIQIDEYKYMFIMHFQI